MQNKSILKKLIRKKEFGLFLILILIVLIFSLLKKEYFSLGNLTTILYMCALAGPLMIGFGALMISGNADMSVAAVGTISAIFCCKLISAGIPWPVAVIFCMAMGGCMGALNAMMWYKFRIMPFIGTLGMANVWNGLASFLTKNQAVHVDNASFFKLGSPLLGGVIPISFIYVVVLIILYGILLSKTKFGRSVYMSGGNMFAARISGINTVKVGTIMMINCSALSAFGGIVLASRMHTITADSLTNALMGAITPVFLGGISFGGGNGSMFGAFLGLLLLNGFNNGLILVGMGTYWQVFAQGALLIIALLVDVLRERARGKGVKLTKEFTIFPT
jgi:ribose transport system permease protein